MSFAELNLLLESGRNVVSFQTQLTERGRTIERLCSEVAIALGLPCFLWNLGQGCFKTLAAAVDNVDETSVERFQSTEPSAVLEFLIDKASAGVFILEDLHSFLHASEGDMASQLVSGRVVSQAIALATDWAECPAKFLVLLGSREIELPPILTSIIPEVWHPLPDYEERVAMLSEFLPQLAPGVNLGLIPQLALSAGGLTLEEMKAGLRQDKVRSGGLLDNSVELLLDYKVKRLQAFDLAFTPRPNVGDFGGMDRIREAIYGVKQDYTRKARQLGMPLPKGWLLVGPPGTGKTFVSKFCAQILEFPTISADAGAIAAGGASYLRRSLDRIEASAPAVVYFDELDKLFPESGQPADLQGRQVLGLLLTWLQDKVSQTFVIATLNRLDSLPPELTRLGRFDEIFYVGFPQAGERKEILHLHLARFDERYRDGNSPMTEKEWRVILNRTVNCTGAELSIMVEKAAKKLFHEGLEIRIGLAELLAVREEIVPLYVRDTDRILKIENVAKQVGQPCSSPDRSIYAPPLLSLWGQKLERE
jgi:hypothetical protein